MSTFANPAGTAGASGAEYTAALLDLLGERDPLQVMEESAPAVRAAVAGLSPEAAREREAPGKWSVLEVVRHLVDTEVVYGYRLRKMVAEEDPDIEGYDQDRWTERLRHNDGTLADALDELEALRRMNLRLLRGLREAEWERVGRHRERGPESVRHVAKLLAAHDLVHLRQIERIKQAIGSE